MVQTIPPDRRIRLTEELMILLLGVKDTPIPSRFHLQKELFILTTIKPKLKDVIIFDIYQQGVYSQEVTYSLYNMLYYKDAVRVDNDGKIYLTTHGKEAFESIKQEYKDSSEFKYLLKIMKMIRVMYDKLTKEEFALLLYTRYPETAKVSTIIDNINTNKKEIIEALRKKGYITEERYKELLATNINC